MNFTTDLPTSDKAVFFLRVRKSLFPKIKICVRMSKLMPKTAILFGVMPHSAILNTIAESATPLTITVTNANNSKTKVLEVYWFLDDCSATEKLIKANTPINRILKVSKNSRSL